MTKSIRWLAIILLAQLALWGVLLVTHSSSKQVEPSGPLVSFEPPAITEIKLSDGKQDVTLTRTDDGSWRLPGTQNLPVDKRLVDEALTKLSQLQRSWPVTTTDDAHARYQVATSQYLRKVDLLVGGDTVAELYIGDSPGLRQSHVRVADEAPVYSVALTAQDLPVEPARWLDKSLLSVSEAKQISNDNFSLARAGGSWTLQVDGKKADLVAANAAELAKSFAELRVTDLAESWPDKPEKTVKFSVVGGQGSFQFEFAEQANNYWVRRLDSDLIYRMGQYQFEKFSQASVASLQTDTSAKTDTKALPGAELDPSLQSLLPKSEP